MYKWLKVKASALKFQHILQVQPLLNSMQVKFYVSWNFPKLY